MNRLVERLAPWFMAAVVAGAVTTGALVSVGTGVLVVAGGLICAVLVLGYLAVDALLSPEDAPATGADVQQSELAELERDKAAILQSIRDLENERDLGKVSAADFQNLDAFFRKRAIEVMKKIDRDLSSFHKRAEAMVAERIERSKREPAAAPVAAAPAPVAADPWPVSTPARTCGACATPVDSDSVFCKKCGKRVTCACGAPLDADSVFCKKCGAKVEAHA